ncbi:hypothetical protein CROQUDRAFT_652793 [Cronartium quercuum f. sp. fusiforme G11]|uniref:BD-FAE-like domain-containing protein n=1 Tax=Cronartium quercuum f. sp. fusiforme G11 TaxID=708437 RepID=A0A9P6NQD1_9BASI|nr:hypothetical protein CROQUDRAFT_652793 [Cronartium quercuum f. sp. fusiforme G11]
MLKKQTELGPPPPQPAQHPALARSILLILIPSTILAIVLWPLCLALSLLPFFGFIGIPWLLILSLFLLYGLSSIPYLLFAQDDPPEGSSLLVLPLSPFRAWRVVKTMFQQTVPIFNLGLLELVLDFSYRRIIVLGGRKGKSAIVHENIAYNTNGNTTKRLDVYVPPEWSSTYANRPYEDGLEADHSHVPSSALAPVIVFVHPGGWSFTHKGFYIQLALRLRRLGFCVIVPNFTQFPEGRCDEAVRDLRKALAWVQRSAHLYGGDGDRTYLMGHGSGAHLALLTIVQDAVVRSRDDSPPDVPMPPGLSHLKLPDQWTCAIQVEGLILLAGIYDPVKHVRTEARTGLEVFSTLRRALGPSHAHTLLHSPAHLLYASKHFLQPDRLPSKVLLVHGGRDTNVPIVQSVLCKTLLVGVGVEEVRLRAYRELGHMDALVAMMMDGRRYGSLIDSEIVSLVTS